MKKIQTYVEYYAKTTYFGVSEINNIICYTF